MPSSAAPTLVDLSCRSALAISHDYVVFGGVLRAEFQFPELKPAPGVAITPDWTVSVNHCEPPLYDLVLVGQRSVREEQYQLFQHAAGLRLVHSHAGTFDIANGGSCILWYYDKDALPEYVRNIVLGPAISLALELSGFLCLHGSAVAIGDAGVAFVGPKHFGKSTLATALTAAGARLIGDDLLVVSAGPPATVRPGVASVRLWADMTSALPLGAICETLIPGVKTTATGFLEEALAGEPASLRAIYVLSPVRSAADVPTVRRSLLSPSEATIALAHQTKLPPPLVGLRAAGTQLIAAAAVAGTVPVWILHPARDIGRLGPLVSQIIEWSSAE